MAEISNIAKLPELTPKFWKDIGKLVGGQGGLIWKDCEKGIMQNGSAGYMLSPKYAKYKANNMRRFTDGQVLGTPTPSRGNKISKTPKKRQFPLQGRKIIKTGLPKVTMLLTGDTVRGLKAESANKNGVTMSYEPKDTVKIIGNAVRGYDIVGLNKVNKELVRQRIIKEYQKNKVKYLNKDIKLGVAKL